MNKSATEWKDMQFVFFLVWDLGPSGKIKPEIFSIFYYYYYYFNLNEIEDFCCWNKKKTDAVLMLDYLQDYRATWLNVKKQNLFYLAHIVTK